jgi:hypothetical protein
MDVDGKQLSLTPAMTATVGTKAGKRKLIEYRLSPPIRMTDEAAKEG